MRSTTPPTRSKGKRTIPFRFSEKHKEYIRECQYNTFNVAEGAVRAGKSVDNIYAFAHELKTTPDRIHIATGATVASAKMVIGDSNGFGLEHIFRGQCRWGKFKDNDALIVKGPATGYREKIVVFAGGGKADSYKKIRGSSYGMWIATEINLHHDTMIKECFARQLAARRRKVFWDLNPEHPRADIYVNYIDRFAERASKGELLGGYHYQHFTIFDNVTITPQRRKEIISQYEPGSIWYIRDIEGKRAIAEGLCYPGIARDIAADDKSHVLTVQQTIEEAQRGRIQQITVGVDFGGNGSGHAFSCSAQYKDGLIALASEWHDAKGTSPRDLERLFIAFVEKILDRYGYIANIYVDSAEQVLKEGLIQALYESEHGDISLRNARKSAINDRIFCLSSLHTTGRFWWTDDCESLLSAISMATWDPKQITDMVRLDNGTSDIDSLDAFEYSFERDIKRYIRKETGEE